MRMFRGRSMRACWRIIEERLGQALPAGFDGDFARREHAALAERPLRMPGLSAALEGIDALGLATCVASSGAHAKMRVTLGGAGLLDRFEGRIFSASSDVARGKPHPDVFEHAAATLGFEPGECAVVEDSVPGVEAGRAAGMRVLGFAREVTAERLFAAGAEPFDDLAALPGLLGAAPTSGRR
jgi:HAD superfamily hydrolase (TIGR01509 family)